MRALGHNPKEADVARLLPENVEKDGRIPFETFLPMLQDISQKLIKDSAEHFVEGFAQFDTEANGFMSSFELRLMLTGRGERLNDEEFDELVSGFEDNQGNVDYGKFIRMVMEETLESS